jgi:hypothetical protein
VFITDRLVVVTQLDVFLTHAVATLFSNTEPAALYEYIEQQLQQQGVVLRAAELRGVVRHDDAYMTSTVSTNGTRYELVNREQAFESMDAYIRDAIEPRDDKTPAMACVVASPGGGKTRLLDEIGRKFSDQHMCVTVSFNSKTSSVKLDRTEQHGIMWRMILFYFCGFPRDREFKRNCFVNVVDTLDVAKVGWVMGTLVCCTSRASLFLDYRRCPVVGA